MADLYSRTIRFLLLMVAVLGGGTPPGFSGERANGMPELEALIESLESLQQEVQSPDEMMRLIQQRMREFYPDSRPTDGVEFFETRIRPLLSERCYECHGPEKQKSDLRFDSRDSVFRSRDAGAVVVPGRIGASRLLQVVSYQGELKMPPNRRLSPDEVNLLSHWIEMGAPWPDEEVPPVSRLSLDDRIEQARREHWAFQPVHDPSPPTGPWQNWVRTPIDAFVAARLSESGLSPSSPAPPQALLRRIYFDLIGLPPTYEEVREFLQDPSDESYEKTVDRLLASPQFGERWGRYWLDVARYADTKGYVFNEERTYPYSHTYRDYVIRAFNQDLPYDRFLTEQIAADHLDLDEDKRPLAALGFLTLGRRFVGNVHDIIDDRIDVVTRGLLGLTVTCARCHEHKYDPISAEDYYSLYGIFRSSEEPEELPLIEDPDPSRPLYREYLKAVEEKKRELNDLRESLHREVLSAAREKVTDYLLAVADVWESTGKIDYRQLRRSSGLEPNLIRRWHQFLKKRTRNFDPIFFAWKEFGLRKGASEAERASLAQQLAENSRPEKTIHPLIAEALARAGTPTLAEIAQLYGNLFRQADREWKNLLSTSAQRVLQSGSRTLEIPAGLGDRKLEPFRRILYTSEGPLDFLPDEIDQIVGRDKRNRITRKKNAVAKVEATHPGRPSRAQALVDSQKMFDPYVFKRGKPGNRGDKVPRRFLTLLAPDRRPFTRGSGRLELARAIVSETNPLTARVYVNRVWMHLFGKPLVSTPSDFGVRCDPPTHPDLLDHLASRFVRQGWSTKKLIREIVLSNTYRQASSHRPEALALDPENWLLWRQNRRRLDFEAMRDSLLMVSGRLNRKMGGFPVNIVTEPFTTRRTVYSLIERQNLPAVFRTFDFASPDLHSPRRYETLVPQQALFLLNSPFMAEMAGSLADRPEVTGEIELEERIQEIYRLVLGRDPDTDETEMGIAFLRNQVELPPPPKPKPPVWSYGYGKLDEEKEAVSTFVPFPYFGNNRWKIGQKVPDKQFGWIYLDRMGGHPEVEYAVIRRWTSPVTGTLSIEGHLKHGSDQGDGVWGFVVSSREGIVWKGHALGAEIPTDVTATSVAVGDTLDLVVSAGPTQGWDSFTWHPKLTLVNGRTTSGKREWLSRIDFAGPPPRPPRPLSPLERYAQVLLLTNEFAFLD